MALQRFILLTLHINCMPEVLTERKKEAKKRENLSIVQTVYAYA